MVVMVTRVVMVGDGRLDVESMGNPSTGVTARARDRRRARWRSRCRAYDDDASTTTTWDTFSRKTTIKGKTTRSARAIALSRVRVRTSRAIDRGQAPSSVCLRIENYPHARDLASRRTTREISRATVGDDGGGGGANDAGTRGKGTGERKGDGGCRASSRRKRERRVHGKQMEYESSSITRTKMRLNSTS